MLPCYYALLILFVGLINILHPHLVKTQLSKKPSNGEVMTRRRVKAPYKKKKINILRNVG